jgi:hypothetical protein
MPDRKGSMRKNLIIIDDFLENATQLREIGLSLSFPDLPGYFPGRNSVERISIDGLTDIVDGITGETLQPVVEDFSHGKFRIALSGDAGAGDIHFDFSATWSGVLFLTRPEDCQGGTAFFRHRASGTEQAPPTLAELQAMGYSSYDQLVQKIVREDGIDRAKWDMQFNVPMRFNRLVLFNSWLWHTAGPSFGDRLENGRLVYLMFFAPRPN